jgi:hypothetical protein
MNEAGTRADHIDPALSRTEPFVRRSAKFSNSLKMAKITSFNTIYFP